MIVEDDLIGNAEQFKLRIKEKGYIHQIMLEHLGISPGYVKQTSETEGKTEEIYLILKERNILTNKCEFREFLATISHLWCLHSTKNEIIKKIQSLLKVLREDIQNIFSEKEIFSDFLFQTPPFIIRYFLEQNIISIETIIQNINLQQSQDDLNFIKYLYPEIRKYDEEYLNQLLITDESNSLKKFVEENDQNLEFFYKIRDEGIKEPKIVELIREDKIDEFISFIEYHPMNLNTIIKRGKTIYGSYFLGLAPIDYSALFGSVEIFKYLYLKNVDIKINVFTFFSNTIEYAILGRNYEIIHLLEERKEIIEELNSHQQKYLELSIKMHYNEIFEYLISNYNYKITVEVIKSIIQFRNFQLLDRLIERSQIEFKDKAITTNIFHGFCKSGNEEIVKMLMNQPNLDINSKDRIFDHFVE